MIFFHEEEYIVAIFNCNIVECCCWILQMYAELKYNIQNINFIELVICAVQC